MAEAQHETVANRYRVFMSDSPHGFLAANLPETGPLQADSRRVTIALTWNRWVETSGVPPRSTVMLLDSPMALTRRVAFSLTASDPLMLLRAAGPTPMLDAVVGMHVGTAIGPSPAPMRVADDTVRADPRKSD